MKRYLLVLAIAAAASSAHAAWQNGVTDDYTTGNGEAILSVWDSSRGNSYSQDLGVTFNQLRAGYTGTINLNGTVLAQAFSASSDLSKLQYSVWAFSNAAYSSLTYEGAFTQAGFVYSLAPGQDYLSELTDETQYNAHSFAWSMAGLYSQGLNFGTDTYGALPVRAVLGIGNDGYANSGYFEKPLENGFSKDFSAGNGQSSQLWLQGFADNDGASQLQQQLGTATLNITSANSGTLSISSVPLPTAAWLFGTSLIGIATAARRRKQQTPQQPKHYA